MQGTIRERFSIERKDRQSLRSAVIDKLSAAVISQQLSADGLKVRLKSGEHQVNSR